MGLLIYRPTKRRLRRFGTAPALMQAATLATTLALPAMGLALTATGATPALAEPSIEASFDATFTAPAAPIVPTTSLEAAPNNDEREIGSGVASFYANSLAGRRTANGDVFDPGKLTAAHRTLPFGSRVRVTNERTGRSVIVRINDRGPFHGNRVIDLSRAAASQIGIVNQGSGRVELALLN